VSLLSDLQTTLSRLSIPIETGFFSDAAPKQYIVVIPLSDSFDLFADNAPGTDVQEARISLFSQGSYTALKNRMVKALLADDFVITDRRYNGFETETGYHHYVVDVAQHYEMEE